MSDLLEMKCSECGQRILYPSERKWQTVECPTCGEPVRLTPPRRLQVGYKAEYIAEKSERTTSKKHHKSPLQEKPSELLPIFTSDLLRGVHIKSTSGTYVVDLLDYTCDSPLCRKIHSGLPPRDLGRLCKHIIIALRKFDLVAQLPPIARGIAQNGYPDKAFGVYPGRFAKDRYGHPIYITGKDDRGWVSVFALAQRNSANYLCFRYNIMSRKWVQIMESGEYNWIGPKIDKSILY